jgi:hypothetical protein
MKKKKVMKRFNISNKLAYTLMVILSIVLLGVGVYAAAPNPGHSANQIGDWPACTSGQVLGVVSGALTCVTPSATDARFWVGTTGSDKGKLCYNNPYSSCTTQSVYCSKTRGSYVNIGSSCSGFTQSYLDQICQSFCNDDSIACDGSVSGCSGTSVSYVGSGVCFSGGDQVWCSCDASGYYNQATYIPSGTRCI